MRVLGAICKVCPELVSIESMEEAIREQWKDEVKVDSARKSYERVESRIVEPGEGNPETPFSFDLPGWTQMEEGIVVRGITSGRWLPGWPRGL